jgi:serine/threonine protein kinase/Tol biopolymer transport system component
VPAALSGKEQVMLCAPGGHAMSDARWVRIEGLLQSALGRPAEEREAFIRDACPDDDGMRDEVLSLLAHAGSADKFLEPPPQRAPLPPGAQLGAYEIRALIGGGGMGEVYRAHDSRLRRDIAIKILPPEAADAERRQRFAREAQAVAALNHPGIVTIHSVEQSGPSTGSGQATIHFLTMELVDGQPLSALIPPEGVGLDRLLGIAVPLVDAIGAAHARGIVHRDLKPANVMITREGRIKVLDFGLAKLKPSMPESDPTTNTIAPVTNEGRLLGTVAYMSPEQAEGRDVDHRSDIFSLGVMLYELATGSRPFKGDTSLSLLSSILKDTPQFVTDVKPSLPRELGRIVRRCLAKSPDRRYQSAIDLRNELEELGQESAAGTLASGNTSEVRPSSKWRSVAWMTGGAVLLFATVVSYLAWRGALSLSSRSIPPSVLASAVKLEVPIPESVKAMDSMALSLDGRRLVFAGGSQLWVYDLESRRVAPVTGIVGLGPQYPFWSPDGQTIAYFQPQPPGFKLMRIPASGGIADKICDFEPAPRGGAWGADDTVVFAQTGDGLFRVHAAGGMPVRITQPNKDRGEQGHSWPQFLPDGRRFTYMTAERLSKIYIASVDSPADRRLVAPEQGASTDVHSRAFAVSGYLLTGEGRTLRARPLDSSSTNPAGVPVSLVEDIRMSGISGDVLFAASPAVLVYSAEKARRSQFSLVDRSNQHRRDIGPPVKLAQDLVRYGWSLAPPPGETLAFTQIGADWIPEIWLLDFARMTPERLTGPDAMLPLWSRSGTEITFTKGGALHSQRLGSPTDFPITKSDYLPVAHDWHPDGRLLFSRQTLPTRLHNFWLLEANGQQTHWLPSPFNHVAASFSPNGQWVAYASTESTTMEVYVRPFSGADRKYRISANGGNRPRWRPDGKALFYVQGDSLMEVELEIGETVKRGRPRRVLTLGDHCGYAVLPDGKGFVLCRPIDPIVPPTITVVINWAAGLTRQ